MVKVTKVRIHCPISRKEETVYIRHLDYKDVHLRNFNGCESSFHSCQECESCKRKALEIFGSN